MKPIDPISVKDVSILERYQHFSKKIKVDIAYIDPPYNSNNIVDFTMF